MNRFFKFFCLLLPVFIFTFSCSANKTLVKQDQHTLKPVKVEKISDIPPELNLSPEIERQTPKNRLFSFSARETPLEDVLAPIVAETGMNVVWEKGVNPRTPVTVSLQSKSLEEALEAILAPTEYLYSTNSPSLHIKLFDTEKFELGEVPNKIMSNVTVGGDVLGTNQELGELSGSFQVSGQTREESVDLWKQVEEGVKKLISSEGDFFINRVAGIVVVTDRKKNLKEVEKFIDLVKNSLGRQVIIEAEVLEVSLEDQKSYGIDWSALTSALIEKHRVNLSASQNLSLPGSVLEFSGSTPDVSFLFNTLGRYGKVKVLSKPRLNVLNGQTAVINVGTVQTYWELSGIPGGVQIGQPVLVPKQKAALIGMLMGVTPFISPDGYVTLQVVPIVTNINKFEEFNFQGQTLRAPNLDIREMSTTVGVRAGESVILGGLITNKQGVTQKKVPILGDIPLLGFFFKRDERTESRAELVIVLTPKVTQLNHKEE
jgi:MSHA type pilus biogenesis protein MshL